MKRQLCGKTWGCGRITEPVGSNTGQTQPQDWRSFRGLLPGGRGPGGRAEKPAEPMLVTWAVTGLGTGGHAHPAGHPQNKLIPKLRRKTEELSRHLLTSRAEAPQCGAQGARRADLVPGPAPRGWPTAEKSVELSARGGGRCGGGGSERLDNLVLENTSS